MSGVEVSVIVPTYNRARLVARAVASVLPQLQPSDELIVVDDGSTDGTEAALAPWRGLIRYLPLTHGGAGRARNIGWAAARGRFVGFLDSDDEWLPGKLAIQRALLLARPELVYCWTDFAVRSAADGAVSPHGLSGWQDRPQPWERRVGPARPLSTLLGRAIPEGDPPVHVGQMYLQQLDESCVSLMSCLVRRAAVPDGLGCAEDLPTYEDWQAVGRLTRCGPGAFIAADLMLNHSHRGPRLSAAHVLVRLEARRTIIRRVWGSDATFLASHAHAYCATLSRVEIELAREYLAQGRNEAARQALAAAGGGPLAYQILARLPPALVRRSLALRRSTMRQIQAAGALALGLVAG